MPAATCLERWHVVAAKVQPQRRIAPAVGELCDPCPFQRTGGRVRNGPLGPNLYAPVVRGNRFPSNSSLPVLAVCFDE